MRYKINVHSDNVLYISTYFFHSNDCFGQLKIS